MAKGLFARRHGGLVDTSPSRLAVYLFWGFGVGLFLGYLLMGTAQAMLETRGNAHFGRSNRTSSSQGGEDAIHTLATSNGSPYQNYQMRIAYATYNLVQTMPGGERHVAFTRILHRTQPDALMDEMPTFRADPLQPACDEWCEYPVSDRANAVRQFFEAAAKNTSMIKAKWLYMIESDYVFMKPLALPKPSEVHPGRAWAFPFDYISPTNFPNEMRKLFSEEHGPVHIIPNTGPAPLLMQREDWELVTPDWERLAAVIEADKDLVAKLGWVREMYGFSVALALQGIGVDLAKPPQNRFISQLPIDDGLGEAHAFHYTQCTIYKTISGEKDVWGYDKRFYTAPEVALLVPRIEDPPKWKQGAWKFIEGNPVTREKHEAIVQMIGQMNKGIETLKDLSSR